MAGLIRVNRSLTLRNRVFRLTATGGVGMLRDGSVRRIQRQPAEPERYS